MSEAWIIDACRTPRGIGKKGKGALAHLHPQHLGATVLKAIAERNQLNTAEVDDIIFGTSSQRGQQGGDLARMAALDAGYNTLASGVTLDRFCGSGITAVNLAAASIMSGMEDLVIGGGCEMMSTFGQDPNQSPFLDSDNLHLRSLHPQPHQGVCADAIATLEGIDRTALDSLAVVSQQRADHAIKHGYFDRSLVPVYNLDGSLALGHEEFPRPQTTLASLAELKPSFEAMANYPLNDSGVTFGSEIRRVYPDLVIRHVHHAGNSSGVVDGAAAVLLASPRVRQGPRSQAQGPLRRHGEYRRLPHPDAQRTGTGGAQSAEKGRSATGGHRPVRDQRGLLGGGGKVHPRPEAGSGQGQRQRRGDGAGPSDRRDRLGTDRHPAGRTRAPRQAVRPGDHVRRRGHGPGDHHRADLGCVCQRGGRRIVVNGSHQRLRQLEACCKLAEKISAGNTVVIQHHGSGRIDLYRHHRVLDLRRQRSAGQWVANFIEERAALLPAEPERIQPLHDAHLLLRADLTVGHSRGDHCPQHQQTLGAALVRPEGGKLFLR